jgi:hypothetical protein
MFRLFSSSPLPLAAALRLGEAVLVIQDVIAPHRGIMAA